MKALVKYAKGEGNMEIRDIQEPLPGPGQIKIEVKNAGICGSDLHIYHDDIVIPLNYPVVTGHEFCGVVAQVGEGVKDLKPGDRVTSETAFSFCGDCEYCISGFYNLCNERKTLGYWYNGAFAKYTVVPHERVHVLPDNIDFVSGAMIEPLACVSHAVLELTEINEGDIVVVSGPGAIGIMAGQAVKQKGAVAIITGTYSDVKRLELAQSLGIEHTVDISKTDLKEYVYDLGGGLGADALLECSGSAAALNSGLELVKKRGSVTQIGLFGKPVTVDFEKIATKELIVTGSFGSKHSSWKKAIHLVSSGAAKLRPLVSDIMPVTEWKEAFQKFNSKEGLKLVLRPV